MKNVTTHTGTLRIVERLKSSTNGNPRYLLTVGHTVCRTSVDSSYGYTLPNLDGKEVTATIGIHYNVSTLDSVEKVMNQADFEQAQKDLIRRYTRAYGDKGFKKE